MYEFSMATTKHRQERGTAGKPDVFSYLVGEDQPKQADLTLNELDADSESGQYFPNGWAEAHLARLQFAPSSLPARTQLPARPPLSSTTFFNTRRS